MSGLNGGHHVLIPSYGKPFRNIMRSRIVAPMKFWALIPGRFFVESLYDIWRMKPHLKPHWNRGFRCCLWSLYGRSQKSTSTHDSKPYKNNNYFPLNLWILYVNYNLLIFSSHVWSKQIPNLREKTPAAKSPPSGKAGNVASIKSVVSISKSSVSDETTGRKCSFRKSLTESYTPLEN